MTFKVQKVAEKTVTPWLKTKDNTKILTMYVYI